MSVREFSAEQLEEASERIYSEAITWTKAYDVAEQIATIYGLTREDLLGKCRDAIHVEARLALYRKLRDAKWSYPMIGEFVGRHHTTIMYALGANEASMLKKTSRRQASKAAA